MSVQRAKSRHSRVNVPVRSYVDNHILRYASHGEARLMIGENADGSQMLGEDGKPIEPVAKRISRPKQPLEIKLLAPLRNDGQSGGTIPIRAIENNAFVHQGVRLSPQDSMRQLDADVALIAAWPEVYDDQAPTICAGRAVGVVSYPPLEDWVVNFA
jgi:hypothetical protein